ncbi:unannotated protein [freshwater metagenome]|uniref:Unannotated protein n=1 Tax=freshwater metagenome TaxID=449393 RepID=A0A6J6J8X7_9ZZZZ
MRGCLFSRRGASAEVWDGREKFLGIRDLGVFVDIDDRTRFDDASALHDKNVVSHVGDNAHVVGDEDDARSETLVERSKQIENFRLNRHVESRRRLVGDEYLGVTRNRLGNHRTLALATGQLVRVRIESFERIGQFDEPEQFNGACLCRGSREFREMHLERFDDLKPDRVHRVHRRHRLLENDRDFTPTNGANPFGCRRERVFSAKENSSRCSTVCGQKPKQGH